jgi:4-hydroxybenzoyl-CoA thioesterase
VRFLRPVAYDDHVAVFTTLEALGTSSLKYRHCLVKGGEVAVECRQTRVWCGIDPGDGKSLKGRPVPVELVAKLMRG